MPNIVLRSLTGTFFPRGIFDSPPGLGKLNKVMLGVPRAAPTFALPASPKASGPIAGVISCPTTPSTNCLRVIAGKPGSMTVFIHHILNRSNDTGTSARDKDSFAMTSSPLIVSVLNGFV